MCGIFGVLSPGNNVDLSRFERSLLAIKHRGPDNQQTKKIGDFVAFGHTRLSIIDLSSTNNQPYSIDDRYTLVYNGEIYNYIELKAELEAMGVKFKTLGDTEVLLQAYINWGEHCVTRFNGMWAFGIYDQKLDKLFCSRDRFGVKPFVYHSSGDEFMFGSEIKPLISYKPALKKPNYNAIANYCHKSLGAQAKETWFTDIYRLPPAHNLIVSEGKVKTYKYWRYPEKVDASLTFEEAKAKFKEIFVDAVRIRMRSDVPVGSTLSSGLDSTSIVGVLTKHYPDTVETFTAYSPAGAFTENDKAGFAADLDLDESKVVKKMTDVLNVRTNLIKVSFDDYLTQLSEAIYHLESGHSSPAIICIHQLYKEARKKVKVLLEGQGADELLAGYIIEAFSRYLVENVKRGNLRKVISEYRVFSKTYSPGSMLMLYLRSYDKPFLNFVKNLIKNINIFSSQAFDYSYIKDNIHEETNFDQSFNKYLYRKHTSGLVNLLHYGDALSMAEGIETRLPFMDYRLVEFSFQLPYDFKVRELQGKYIQRKALAEYIPDRVAKSLIKLGFATPIDRLITKSKEVEDVLLNQPCGELFNEKNVARMLEDHRAGKHDHSTILFRILSAKIWYRTFFQ